MKLHLPKKLRQTIRGRLTLWYMASTIGLTLVLTSLFGLLLWITLHSQIDHHIHVVVTEAKQIVENYHGEEQTKLLQNLVGSQGMTVVLLSADGAPLLQTNSSDVAAMSEHQMQQVLYEKQKASGQPRHFTIGTIRFASMPVNEGVGQGVLAVGYTLAVIEQAFWKLALIMAGVVLLVLVPVWAGGYWLIKKSLSPVELMATAVDQISEPEQLKLRIKESELSMELVAIARAFNRMMAKLEQIFTREHEFFSDAAHTLKTPLAVLRSQMETLPNEDYEIKTKGLAVIDRLAETIQELLLISRLETGYKGDASRVNLSQMVTGLSELASTLGEEKNLLVKTKIQNDVWIHGEEKLLRRALSNVVHNAVIYSKRMGRIELGLQKAEDKIVVIIKDQGMGISKQDLPKVFDRFYRAGKTNKSHGSGLGLSITKAVVESMGGKIEVKSRLGRGTQVRMEWPVV